MRQREQLPCIIIVKASLPALRLHQFLVALNVSHAVSCCSVHSTFSLQPLLRIAVHTHGSSLVLHSLAGHAP
jgi:hypothetical protein